MTSIPRPPVLRASLLTLALLLAGVMIFLLVDKVVAFSVLLGGLLVLVPHSYFAVYAFRYRGAKYAQQTKLSFYRGQVGKFVLTLVGFALLFALYEEGSLELNLLALFGSYIATLAVNLLLTARLLSP